LDEVQVCEFDAKEYTIHCDDDGINGDELVHCFSDVAALHVDHAFDIVFDRFGELEQAHGLLDVYDRDDKLLHKENHHLDLLHNAVPIYEAVEGSFCKFIRVGAESKNGRDRVQQHAVGDDHVQGVFDDAL